MNLIKMTRVAGVVCALLALSAGDTAAQAPYQPLLTVTANGSTVTIQWTPIAEALAYNIQVGSQAGSSDIASLNLPNFITRIVVAAPDGTYYLRVRALAGPLAGPFSNEASVTVGGGGGCTPPAAPTVSFTVSGPSVTINWGAVANADAYRVEFSRTPGITELAHNVTNATTSFTQYVGIVGTFYARVVSGNACGTATGNEVAFTITTIGGSGPRTPDPAPGQLLPEPPYGRQVAEAVARVFPGDVANSCVADGGNNLYMFRLLNELRKRDSRWGLNDKRGQEGDLSQDIITYNPTNRPDDGESQVYLFDIISGHCGSSPDWNWLDVTGATWGARGSRSCGTEWCARWTIDAYLRAGFPPDPK